MKIILFFFLISSTIISFSQHQHNKMPMNKMEMKKDTVSPKNKMAGMNMKKDTVPHEKMKGMKGMKNMSGMKEHEMTMMSHSYSRNLPMNRNSSGTAWQPDATPMYGYMIMGKKWNWMVHGSIFFRYDHQDITTKTSRSDSLKDRWDAPNWIMLMGDRKIKQRGLLNLTLMVSADELVMGEDGYPLLFQSGETFNGKPLVDRQHPHDLFSGLSIGYTHMFSKDMDLTGYFGYPGEPAIGPPAFMHRISAFNNPDAPLGHHWQDATHITFGVATLGFRYKILKLEFSTFTGREPDENRYDFDKPRFDSYSWRLSANPTDNFSLQLSQAFLKGPENIKPKENVTRTTASVLHSIILGEKTHLTSAAIWGMNQEWHSPPSHSALLESNLQVNKGGYYMRFETIRKEASDLQIDLPNGDEHELFPIQMLTIGTSYNFLSFLNTNLRAGIQGSLFINSKKLRSVYGTDPLAFEAYLHLVSINTNALKMKHKHH